MAAEFTMPRPAATVAIVRPGVDRPEVLMMRRSSRGAFASHHVFPGGVVDEADGLVHSLADGVDAAAANEMLGVENGLDFYSAAIREAFEEAGVLFARDSAGQWALLDRSEDEISGMREALLQGSMSWPAFLSKYEWRLAFDALKLVAYWVTPREQRRRFSTRFFVAALPEGQIANHEQGELLDSCWMMASDVIAAGNAGEMKLMYPTWATLRGIVDCPDIEGVMTWADRRLASGEARLLPAFAEVDGQWRVVLPGSPHYPKEFET